MDGEGVELELQLQEIDKQENCDDEKTETSISVEVRQTLSILHLSSVHCVIHDGAFINYSRS